MLCALIQDSTVVAVETLQDSDIQAMGNRYQNIIQIDGTNPQPQVGWTWDGQTFTGPPGTGVNWKITKLSFRQRLTLTELVGIQAAAVQNNQLGYTLQVLQGNLTVATYIELARPETIAAVGALVSFGLLTSDRANTILTTPPTALELYQG